MLKNNNEVRINLFNQTPKLNEEDFYKLKSFIEANIGIKVNDGKKILLETRLLKRVKSLNFKSFSEYIKYVLCGNDIDEIVNLIDHITTNKTEFFRESEHFEILEKNLLPKLFKLKRSIKIWSAASSSGEEPYTIAMVVYDFLQKNKFSGSFSVLGSDISTKVLKQAVDAIYPFERINQVPKEYYKYFLKSKDPQKRLIRITPEIRKLVSFKRINLLDNFSSLGKFNIIFCRNVFIYFDKKTQAEVVKKFYDIIDEGGYLFIGHSETLNGISYGFKKVSTSIFIKG